MILDGRRRVPGTAEDVGGKGVRRLLRRKEGPPPRTIDVPVIDLPGTAVLAEADRELRSRSRLLS